MGSTSHNQHSIPTDILDDLCSRFIINLPQEDRSNLVRICFQVELAHWFYLDYYCTEETGLNPCAIREFAAHIFQHVPYLRQHLPNLDNVLTNWREYKQSVPTYGAIILDTNLTHVLLVQSYWTKASWGFPKGKVNEGEEPWKCAAREVLEETGFDISKLINKNEYIEATIHDQNVRLYIIGYVSRDTKFQPRTRNEIKACEWFALTDLPTNKKDMTPKLKIGVGPNAFFMVLPFVKRLRRWVGERHPKSFTGSRRARHKSMGDIEASTSKAKSKNISQGLQNEIQDFKQTQGNKNHKNISQGHQNETQDFKQTQGNKTHKNSSQGSQNETQDFKPTQGHKNHKNVSAGSHGSAKNSSSTAGSGKKDRRNSKRQLFTPQNNQAGVASPEQSENAPSDGAKSSEMDVFFNFIAPSWADFKFNRKAILDSLT